MYNLYSLLANIKNNQLSNKSFLLHPKSNLCCNILNILWDEGFILGYKTYSKNKNMLIIFLKYNNNKPSIRLLTILSKSNQKVYYSLKQLWKLKDDIGLTIISTNKGVFSLENCKKLKVGGRPLIFIR